MGNIIEIAKDYNLIGVVGVVIVAYVVYVFTFHVLIPWKDNLAEKLSQSPDPEIAKWAVKKELPPRAWWFLSAGIRIPLYAVLLIAILSAFPKVDALLGDGLRVVKFCVKNKGNCIHNHSGYLKSLPQLQGKASIPCRFVGNWIMTQGSSQYQVSLFETGYYKQEGQLFNNDDGTSTPVSESGFWTVQNETMIWIRGGIDAPNIRTIVMQGDGAFQMAGGGEEILFQWGQTLGTDTCVGRKNQYALNNIDLDDPMFSEKKGKLDMFNIKRNVFISTGTGLERDYAEKISYQIEQSTYLHYPITNRDTHVTGTVKALISIFPDGSIDRVEILETSKEPVLDEIATHIVYLAQPFEPFPPELKGVLDRVEIIRSWEF